MRKGQLRHLDFIVVDIIAIELALLCTYVIDIFYYNGPSFSWKIIALMLPICNVVSGIMLDTYNGILQRGYIKEFASLFQLDLCAYASFIFLTYFLGLTHQIPQHVVFISFAASFPITYFLRFYQKFFLHYRYNNVKYSRQIVVAATEDMARNMISSISGSAIRNYQFFGLAILDHSMIGERIGNVEVAADRDTFISYIQNNVVDEVVLSVPDNFLYSLDLTKQLLTMGVTVHIYITGIFDSLPNRSISNVFGYDVLTTTISPVTFRQSLGKRLMDILGAVAGCLITLILTIIIGPIIFIKSPGPIFFTQIRVGKHGRQFKLYKFRSMYLDAEARKAELMKQNGVEDGMMFKIRDDPRIIKGIGHFIRKTSLDEFPQFFNVLKGDMSLVGTRPPTIDEYERYSPQHKRRLTMLPGITGLWQTSGRNKITDFEEVVRLDTEYIENWSLNGDIKIILKTIKNMVKNDDAF